jgi:hypothetical protein
LDIPYILRLLGYSLVSEYAVTLLDSIACLSRRR